MNILILILRLLHIVGGVAWVGTSLTMNVFIGRSIAATGDAGKQFAGHLMGKARISSAIMGASITSVTAGFLLYAIDSNWFTSAWQSSGPGIGFGLGAMFALIGLVTGIKNGSNNKAMAKMGTQIQGKPTVEQAAKLAAIQQQQAWIVPVNTFSLLLALALMAIARYLHF